MQNNKTLQPLQKIIFGYLKCFIKEYKNLINFDNEDIETIHRLRVASRRLRVAIRLLKPILPYKQYKLLRKEVRRIGRVLGFARQLDVQMKFLKNAKKSLPKKLNPLHIESIIDDLKEKRSKEQKNIYYIIEDFAKKSHLEKFKGRLRKLISLEHLSEELFSIQVKITILKYLDKFLSFSRYAYKPKSIKKLHRMRISAKKLRYALEIIRPWYGNKTTNYINALHEIQDLLGEIHDYDVLTGTLGKFLNKKDKESYKTSDYVLKKISLLRREKYNQFVRYWENLENNGFWVRLRRII